MQDLWVPFLRAAVEEVQSLAQRICKAFAVLDPECLLQAVQAVLDVELIRAQEVVMAQAAQGLFAMFMESARAGLHDWLIPRGSSSGRVGVRY